MSYPTAEDVFSILEPFEQLLMSLHLKAWDRLVSNPEWPTLVYQRTKANIMHDFIVQESSAALDELPGVRRIAHENSVRYLIKDKVLLRFKRGTRSGLGSNVNTQANDDFIDAEVSLLGIPRISKVEILWYPNRLNTKLDRVEVGARDGKHRIWAYPLGRRPDILELPMDLPIAPVRPAERLVTIKPQHNTAKKDQD